MLGVKTSRAAFLGLAVCVAAAAVGRSARADFSFNPTGVGGAPVFTINGFDPSPGNALGQGSTTAIANVLNSGGTGSDVAADRFQLYYMATTSSLIGPSPGNNPLTPPGLNSAYQITYVASVTEFVKTASGNAGTATFGISSVQAANSGLTIYSNGPGGGLTANNGAGTGFTDGTPILTGSVIVPGGTVPTGNFTTQPGTVPLNQHPLGSNYPGIQTVAGSGSSLVDFAVVTTNPAYFVTPPPTVVALRFATSQVTPFTAIEPALKLPNNAGGFVVPNIGTVNGVNGPDFLFTADAFVTPVPEPSSVCLTVLGLGGALLCVRKMRAMAA
jgi:hypothetical protein